jgi:hypothetical protein
VEIHYFGDWRDDLKLFVFVTLPIKPSGRLPSPMQAPQLFASRYFKQLRLIATQK